MRVECLTHKLSHLSNQLALEFGHHMVVPIEITLCVHHLIRLHAMLLIVLKSLNKAVAVQSLSLEVYTEIFFINFNRCMFLFTATETGHGNGPGLTHWNGYKIDISLNSCVDNYIRRWPFIGNRGDGAAMYKAGSGNVYAREKDHWVFNNPC